MKETEGNYCAKLTSVMAFDGQIDTNKWGCFCFRFEYSKWQRNISSDKNKANNPKIIDLHIQ